MGMDLLSALPPNHILPTSITPTNSKDDTISWVEDYELKFTRAMFNFQSLTSAPLCAGQQHSYHSVIRPYMELPLHTDLARTLVLTYFKWFT